MTSVTQWYCTAICVELYYNSQLLIVCYVVLHQSLNGAALHLTS